MTAVTIYHNPRCSKSRQTLQLLEERDLDINAIGGLSVGEPHDLMYGMTEVCCDILPESKPRYLMGVGTPEHLLRCIALGVDMFDCVLPSRNARHGLLYTWKGLINIKNAKWKTDFDPIDELSKSPLSRRHTKAYLSHLFRSGEALGAHIATLHNLTFYLELVAEARNRIQQGEYEKWHKEAIQHITKRL